jgi:hypothetical protein
MVGWVLQWCTIAGIELGRPLRALFLWGTGCQSLCSNQQTAFVHGEAHRLHLASIPWGGGVVIACALCGWWALTVFLRQPTAPSSSASVLACTPPALACGTPRRTVRGSPPPPPPPPPSHHHPPPLLACLSVEARRLLTYLCRLCRCGCDCYWCPCCGCVGFFVCLLRARFLHLSLGERAAVLHRHRVWTCIVRRAALVEAPFPPQNILPLLSPPPPLQAHTPPQPYMPTIVLSAFDSCWVRTPWRYSVVRALRPDRHTHAHTQRTDHPVGLHPRPPTRVRATAWTLISSPPPTHPPTQLRKPNRYPSPRSAAGASS